MPVILVRVVCGLFETIAIFSPSMALRRVDFPTFGLPSIAIKPVLIYVVPLFFGCPPHRYRAAVNVYLVIPADIRISSCLANISRSSSGDVSWS